MKWLSPKVKEGALVYASAFLEACENAKVKDTLRALLETDAYPRLQKIPEVEFAVGWLHGCADTIGVDIKVLWAQICVDLDRRGAFRVARKGRAA